MNLYDNSGINCNKKKYVICIIILFLINSFIEINIKIVLYLLIYVTTKSSAKHVDRQLCYVLKNFCSAR